MNRLRSESPTTAAPRHPLPPSVSSANTPHPHSSSFGFPTTVPLVPMMLIIGIVSMMLLDDVEDDNVMIKDEGVGDDTDDGVRRWQTSETGFGPMNRRYRVAAVGSVVGSQVRVSCSGSGSGSASSGFVLIRVLLEINRVLVSGRFCFQLSFGSNPDDSVNRRVNSGHTTVKQVNVSQTSIVGSKLSQRKRGIL
ncbi:hypothetical protein Hdeb2414_s0034g00725891 [Helianthus debilis subsp. tardiflorus]